jgi:DNA-binding NtrC family response regulator
MAGQATTLKNVSRWLRARRGTFLFLALEGERPLAGGARFDLQTTEEVRIGRTSQPRLERAGGVLHLGLADPWLSSQHLRLRSDDGRWVAEDLGSSNGTFVNGARIQERALEGGDLLAAGHAMFAFRDHLEVAPELGGDLDASQLAQKEPAFATLLPELAGQLAQVARLSRSPVSIVIRGESGTGKEVLARAIHRASGARGAFVAVNCGALPPTLVEASLFGHRKGAFTGADEDRQGLLASAHGGTLLLDEIADLPLPAQAALLRALQEREVLPVGAVRAQPVELRVLAATNRDLPALVAQGRFRADLFARLDGFSIVLPPLRERREDMGLLLAALLRRRGADGTTLTAEACDALLRHRWPLNVREFDNALLSASVLAAGQPIDVEHLPPALRARTPTVAREPDAADAGRRAEIEELLKLHAGNVSAVARALGKERMQVHRWLRRYRLDPATYRK